MVDRWLKAPSIADHFLKVRENARMNIAKSVADRFPSIPKKNKLSIQSIVETSPVVEMVLEYIMSPHTPLPGGGRSSPWKHLAWKRFQEMALRDPQVRSNMEELIRQKTGSRGNITDRDIIEKLKGVKDPEDLFTSLRKKIQRVMDGMRDDPALSGFFDRKRVFDEYIRSRMEYEVEVYIKENNLSMTNPEDIRKVHKFMNSFTNKIVNQMNRRYAFSSDGGMDEELIRSLISGAMVRLSFSR
jgi:hypothetical protein